MSVTLPGEAEIEKSPPDEAGLTVTDTLAELVRLESAESVPVTVNV